MRRACRSLVGLVPFFTIGPGVALAYRPFVSTDAAVADPGEVEIEFGSEGLRLSLWFWPWLWLLEARFSNTRSLLPIGQPRTLPTGSSCISHTSPPSSE